MSTLLQRSLMALVVLILISSTSFANLKKGRIGSGQTRQFELIPPVDGVNMLSLIFDATSTDLDLALGLEDGTLIAASISPERFFETLHVGLIADRAFIVVVESFEGPETAFRLVANSAGQETLNSARAGERETLREVELNRAGTKLRESLRKLGRTKQ